MTRNYLIRRLKVLPRRTTPHLLALAAVILSLFAVLILVSGLPAAPSPRPTPPPASVLQPVLPSPQLSARNIFVLDPTSSSVLYHKSADQPVYPASTTKIMTALITLDFFPLDRIITVSRSYPNGQDAGFSSQEKVSVEQLLYALLIQSANDAAEILAENFCSSLPRSPISSDPSCGRAAFIAAMNTEAQELNLRHTQFQNPTGLDEEGHYSTASDLARLGQFAMGHPVFRRIVSTENAVITTSDVPQTHILTNTNQLLGKIPGVLGIKTGFTDMAGQSLITEVSQNDRRLIFVILGSSDRFSDTEALINWAYTSTGQTGQLPPARTP